MKIRFLQPNSLITFLLLLTFCLVSCERETFNNPNQEANEFQNSQAFFIKEGTLQEYLQKKEFVKLFKRFGSLKNYVSRQSNDELYSFTIDSSLVKEVYFNGITSYTMPILRDSISINYFENLVIQSDSLGNTKAVIIKYNHNGILEAFTEHDSYKIGGDHEIFELDISQLSARTGGSCTTTVVTWCSWGADHIAGTQCYIEDALNGGDRLYTVTTEECLNEDGVTGGGDPTYEGDGGGSTNTGTGNTNDPEPDETEDPIVTSPTPTLYTRQFTTFVGTLDPELQDFLNHPYHDAIKSDVQEYFLENGFSDESEELAIQAINAMILNMDQTFAEALLTYITFSDDKPWIASTGNFNNVPSLSYTHTRTVYINGRPLQQFKLTNGDLISTGDYGIWQDTNYQVHYYSQNLGAWFMIPEPSTYSNLDLEFIWSGFWSAVQTGVRYCTPIEDIIILIDGKDFDGVAQSKAAAGLLIFVDLVPGGKVLKITRKAGHALSAASPVIKITIDAISKTQRNLRRQYKYIIDTATSARKGNFGELCTDLDFVEKGYEVLHTRRVTTIDQIGDNTGIDHIFKNPQTGEFIIVESKYHGTGGLSTLTDGTRQMSDEWISNDNLDNTNRLWKSLDGNMDLYLQIKPDPNTLNYKRVIAYIQSDGTINYKFVSPDGYEINTIFTN